MLWRERYDTRVLYEVSAPRISGRTLSGDSVVLEQGRIAVCGFSPEAFMGMGVWLRLIQAEFGFEALSLVFFSHGWSVDQQEDLPYVIPISLHTQTIVSDKDAEFWTQLIEPDHGGRAFALITSSAGVNCLMIGPPTEERWDEFQLAVRSQNA